MESDGVRSESESKSRGRKRVREGSEGLDRWNLVGRHVRKEFQGIGIFSGRIVRYKRGGLYRVNYEDGDCEDLEYDEIEGILVDEAGRGSAANAEVVAGKEKLDQSVSLSRKSGKDSDQFGESQVVSTKVSSEEDAGSDADSSSVSGKSETLPFWPLPLPPSSGSLGVPEESVSFLFSVYNFLRSFSHQLFLSPFSLEDLVGALNHASPNSLLDAVHVSLLRALRRHLEVISNDSSSGELALKCLRCLDWSLLDTLTWTIYVIGYLYIMGYTKGKDWKGFHDQVLNREYYSLSVHIKLMILQFLCDDLLEFVELRTEINMRESAEEEMDPDDNGMLASENGPKRVHPRYSKTSACKDAVTLENIIEPSESKPYENNSSADSSKLIEPEANASDVVDDGNSDECKLCGMDGMLLCCDGCPYAYHPRCIGLTKASIPEGHWFCPECVVNKMGPVCTRIGRGLRGAEVFGFDPFGRLFLGTCDYVLVLETSTNVEPICRHYSRNDALQLLGVLCSSAQHTLLYSQICKGILQYYEISENSIALHSKENKPETKQLEFKIGMQPEINTRDRNGDAACTTFSIKENHVSLDAVEQENCPSNASQSNVDNGAMRSCRDNEHNETGVNDPTLESRKGGFLSQQKGVTSASEYAESTDQRLCCPPANTKFQEQLGAESTISAMSQVLPTDHSDLNHQSSGERSSVLEFATCASRDADSTGQQDANSMVWCMKSGITSVENRLEDGSDGSKGEVNGCSSYVATSFKPQGYINQYILGDVAASAAANLAVLASENSKASEAQSSSNQKKTTSGDVALQMKAFLGAALHFQWPNSEKKLMDVPRERCGWCFACKFAGSSRKGCLLNLAASIALKGDPKVIGGVRPIRNGEGPFPAIASLILNMEESLRGLIVGPLLNLGYRRLWRQKLELSSTCNSLKYLLLDLEENIHSLAFSGSWFKPVDDWSFKFATAQFGTCNVGLAQKRGPSTRRHRKQSATSGIMADGNWKDVHWWRGGKLLKLLFQTGILPRSILQKAARQGGCKKISGIHYIEGSEIPRKSRRLSWRAAVEMSKNASQLALQVRCLDAHLRWSDLVRPEINSQDGKGLDIETSAFRNAYICDKKIVESKIRYALAFGNQKHLPSRVMKNVIEVEQSQNGKEWFWFSENHIPLYLIKDYEAKAEKVSFMLPKKASYFMSKIPTRRLKNCQGDIFMYLIHRDDASSCALCQQDVLLRNAVKCNTCQGYCHKDCTVPLTAELNDELEFMRICKQCYHTRAAITNKNFDNHPKVQLALQQEQIALASKIMLHNHHPHMPLSMRVDSASKKRPPNISKGGVSRKGTSLTYGLVWKKKNDKSDARSEFRLSNILLRGHAGMDPSRRPVCSLCSEPYNSNLMYIRCQTCPSWYHADAVQLKEEDIFRLEGFKCCKCRRKISPICPHMSEEGKPRTKTTRKQIGMERNETSMMFAVPGYGVENLEIGEPTAPVLLTKTEHVATDDYDPLLFSLENVELITEQMPEISSELDTSAVLYQNAQKLPVRRMHENDSVGFSAYPVHEHPESLGINLAGVKNELVMHEKDSEGFLAYPVHEHPEGLGINLAGVKNEPVSPQAEWDFPISGELPDFQVGGTEEYEPQTYFSFTELLATGDDRMDELFETPTDVPGSWGNSSAVCENMENVGQVMPSYSSYETYDMGMVNSLQEFPSVEPTPNPVQCGMCGHFQPSPDLLCEICCLQIHSHCSPWEEPALSDHRWRCGRCRDWR